MPQLKNGGKNPTHIVLVSQVPKMKKLKVPQNFSLKYFKKETVSSLRTGTRSVLLTDTQ